MKQFIHKILAVAMAFVVLFSTLSFTISMHYCGGNLVDTAFFQKAEGCGMEMNTPSSQGCSITKKNCCSDTQVSQNGQDELQVSLDNISFDNQLFINALVYVLSNPLYDLVEQTTAYQIYKPPIVIRPIYKIDETYLI